MADLRQARSDANASGEQVPMEAFSRTHQFIQAVDDLEGFRSGRKSSPVAASLRSFAVLRARRCNYIQLWAPAQAPPSHAPHPALVHVQAVSPVWMALDALLGLAPAA